MNFKIKARLLLLIAIILASGCATQNPLPKKQPLDTKEADVKRHEAFKERELQIRQNQELAAIEAETQAQSDVWQSVKDGFSLATQSTPFAEEYEQWLAKHPKHVARLEKRFKLVLPYLIEEIQSKNLPMELVLIPMIESGLNTQATSPAGAAGLWQIMPSTGEWLGLRISGKVDERRNIIESTRVSLEYLQYLTDYYDGNWPLGITSYNAGNGNVDKALRKSHKNKQFDKPWKLPLKKESKEYYSKIIGLRNYIQKTGELYPALSPLSKDSFFTVSRTAPSRSFANIAKQYNTDIELIIFLNADYLTQRTLKNRTTILIPKDIQQPLIAQDYAISEIKPSLRQHKIKRGESLSIIASKYNTTVSKLKRLNKLASNLIRVGMVLDIPIY